MRTYIKVEKGIVSFQLQPDTQSESDLLKSIKEDIEITVKVTEHNKYNHGKEYWLELIGEPFTLPF